MNRKGIAMIIGLAIIGVLIILGAALVTRSVSESGLTQKYTESVHAFWLADAGINRALTELKNDYSATGTGLWRTSFGRGAYYIDVATEGDNRRVTSHGVMPAAGTARVERIIEAIMSKYIPPNFYDNAIYSAGNIDFNGNAYSVTGKVRYASEIDNTGNVNGVITRDPTINPLALLDFEQLRAIAETQGNIYDAGRLSNVKNNQDSFPGSFWYSAPTDPADPATGTPNVVYVETDLELNGNIGTIGGFFAVVGNVITDPGAQEEATINGNGIIEGVIYTRGEFNINGGGGNLNVYGGVWAGSKARLNGNAAITYNKDYMDAIKALNINPDVQINSWRDTQNPYILSLQ